MNTNIATARMPAETTVDMRTADSFSTYYNQTETKSLAADSTATAYPKTYEGGERLGAEEADRASIYDAGGLGGEVENDQALLGGIIDYVIGCCGGGARSPT